MPRLLLVFWFFQIFVGIMTFLFTGIAFDVAQVFHFIIIFFSYLNSIDLSYWEIFLMIFFMTFIFFRGLRLTCIISRSEILGGLIIVSILIILIGFVFFFFG